jgi:1-acyl-sn-glycerol-3-phosphate acyltransferase
LDLRVEGEQPQGGLVACNHLGYLDIIALGAVTPLVFLSKREVQGWLLIGAITRLAGTLYINREDKKEVVRAARAFESVVGSGTTVVIFPEGTSSDGTGVLPFRSALLEPAVRGQWPVTPARLEYSLTEGSVAEEVCYWRDMTFFPHLLNLMRKDEIRVTVRFGTRHAPGKCRKALALSLREQICVLGRGKQAGQV